MATATADYTADGFSYPPTTAATMAMRLFAWATTTVMFAYVVSTYMVYWWGWPSLVGFGQHLGIVPGPAPANLNLGLAYAQAGIYLLALVGAFAYVQATSSRLLRADAVVLSNLAAFVVRASYWAVLLVGLADVIISFLRVEGLLHYLVNSALETNIGRAQWRGLYIHTPLLVVALIVAVFTRSVSFVWLTLLVVLAEFAIVITRFIFSYEQAYMGDIVRFWYAALFLLASPYTLLHDGHVRVDVVYAGLSKTTKGLLNMIGCIVLGIAFCWVVLALGTWTRSSVIVAPLVSFEVTQSGFGMYIKYLMAGLLGVFAIAMMVQFASYLLESLADYRSDPGGREPPAEISH